MTSLLSGRLMAATRAASFKDDYVSFSPAAAPSTGTQDVAFKVGGAAGTTVATLTLTYSSGNLSSVAKV
jgi:DNA repair ATPase RecN